MSYPLQNEDSSQGFADRRNNEGIYHKIDSLESRVFHHLESIQENQRKMNEKINILTYQVELINAGLKVVLGVVGVTLIGAVLKNILIG